MDTAADITPFLFEGEHLVRTAILHDGEAWFVGIDACKILDLKNPHTSLARLDADERHLHSMEGEGGLRDVIMVSEAGIYRLVFTSRKPIAERFKRWLAHEVIPAIRKTGSYGADTTQPAGPKEHRPFPEWPMEEMRTKLKCVDGYRMLWGVTAAQWISPQLGFPTPPPELVERGRQFTLTLVPNAPEAA